ncbi:uncharacterized protein LOC127570918 isoform X1 [Pristis pectinata]|uniref:uncharacterized protein LOC127570918 isoform X1 n=1 Tax=Pristis pectinata TaxID=685728 RepID=UPI00223E6FD2|nr:uncharacterized protein LOC127570918 isoform X1 [Pristis pectinata]XP_051872821.1 uncharacterized protein LOC127570918 isoform X1 [Pristis pectinata]
MGDGPQRQDQADREMKVAVLSNVFYCKICDIRCTSEMNLKMHFIGMKHRKHEEALKNVPGRKGEHKNMGSKAFNSVKRKVPAIDAQHCFGSSVFEQHFRDVGIQDPVIGLNYVIEYQSEVSPNPMFFCELCNCGGGFASFMSHVIGCKHRLNYMAKMHPDALQLDGVKLKQSELNALVKEKARYIEKIDGRGRVKVVIEEVPSELSGGNTATKRVPDTYDQSDSRFSHREDFRNNFAQNMNPAGSNFYESRMARSQDGQFDANFHHEETMGIWKVLMTQECYAHKMGHWKTDFQGLRTLEVISVCILTGEVPVPMNQEYHILKTTDHLETLCKMVGEKMYNLKCETRIGAPRIYETLEMSTEEES